jgi:transcriptional regulator with XRE-family HTH domain
VSLHTLTAEQAEALRAVPIGSMPNKLKIAIALTKARQSQIAAATGIPAPNLSDIVNGKYGSITVDTARKLAEYFGCAIEDLFPQREEARTA